MNAKELQSIKDTEYAKSLGYNTDIFYLEDADAREEITDNEQEELEWEMTNLFDYKEKTKEYFKEMY